MNRDPNQRVRSTAGTMTVAELEARVALLEPRVVLMREVPHATAETFAVLIDRARELGSQFDRWVMIVDLSEVTERPRGHYLQMIRRDVLSKVGPAGPIIYLSVVQPGNAFMRTILGFVLGRVSRHITVHGNREAALAACREALADSPEHSRQAK